LALGWAVVAGTWATEARAIMTTNGKVSLQTERILLFMIAFGLLK
jgi:hypothetical protein